MATLSPADPVAGVGTCRSPTVSGTFSAMLKIGHSRPILTPSGSTVAAIARAWPSRPMRASHRCSCPPNYRPERRPPTARSLLGAVFFLRKQKRAFRLFSIYFVMVRRSYFFPAAFHFARVRRPRAVTYIWIIFPVAGFKRRRFMAFGYCRRFVFTLECETLLPVNGFFPVIWQVFDIDFLVRAYSSGKPGINQEAPVLYWGYCYGQRGTSQKSAFGCCKHGLWP